MKKTFKYALLNATAIVLYICVIASFFYYAENIFGKTDPKTVLLPIMMLTLFVFSAALTGVLMFGRPIMWYLDGKKKEALTLLTSTLTIFLIVLVLLASSLYLMR